MRKIALIFFILALISLVVNAQVPEKINYQAVLRNSTGELIIDQNVSLTLSILNISSTGEVLYSEIHSTTTNAFGQVSIEIGGGTDITGDFSTIEWGINDKYLKIEVDAGSGLIDLGTYQLVSVPFSLYAESADSSRVAGVANFANTAEFAIQANNSIASDVSEFADSSRVSGMAYTANKADLLGSSGVYSTSTDTLFVVKDHDGNVVFAVFPDGAEIIVNETAKGKVGGFAVSGRSPAKADMNILRVTTDR
ncbi:MAG: hypothetical protein C0597_09000, partial [Marinilabiliales bacterium]